MHVIHGEDTFLQNRGTFLVNLNKSKDQEHGLNLVWLIQKSPLKTTVISLSHVGHAVCNCSTGCFPSLEQVASVHVVTYKYKESQGLWRVFLNVAKREL